MKKLFGILVGTAFCACSWAQIATSLLTNQSGGNVAQYGVVVADSSNDSSFTTTTTPRFKQVVGVVIQSGGIADMAKGRVAILGIVDVTVTGTVTRGDYLVTSGTAGSAASGGTTNTAGAFAVALEGGTDTNLSCLLYPSLAGVGAGTGLTLNDGVKIVYGTDSDIDVSYDEATDDQLEWTDGTNLLASLKDAGTSGNFQITGLLTVEDGTTEELQIGQYSLGGADRPAVKSVGQPSLELVHAPASGSARVDIDANTADNSAIIFRVGRFSNTTNTSKTFAFYKADGTSTIQFQIDLNDGDAYSTGDFQVKGGDLTVGTAAAANIGTNTNPNQIQLIDANTLYFEGAVRKRAAAATADDTTPSVTGINVLTIPGTWTAGYNITSFDNGATNQDLLVIGGDSDCVIEDGSGNINLNSTSGNWTAAASATLWVHYDGSNWLEVHRSAN